MKNTLRAIFMAGLLLILVLPAEAQESMKPDLKTEALRLFSEKNYTSALPLYRELWKQYPKEPEYMYGTGVCLVMLNQQLEEAADLLRPGTVSEYNAMAMFYLGRALHLQYSFDEAIKAYSKYLLTGKSADIKMLAVERLIEMARNGMELTRSGINVRVQSSQTLQIEQIPLAANINGSGRLLKKPAEFSSKADILEEYEPWMFMPNYTEVNEYVYVAGYDKGQKGQKQIFRIKNINHETWGLPELLDATVNTPYNEESPYFDNRTSTLYFSSTGHSSMGGYDIFRSIYDWNTKSWSKPENLGFPVNSPYDDFMFIIDDLGYTSAFASTRNTGPNQANVYRIIIPYGEPAQLIEGIDDVREASLLLTEPKKELPEITTEQPEMVTPVKSDYDRLLAQALLLQLKADSLSTLVREKRILARETPDDALKKELIAGILTLEKEAKSTQRNADKKFSEAALVKNETDTIKAPDDPVLVQSAEINGIRVYQFRNNSSVSSEDSLPSGTDNTDEQKNLSVATSVKSDEFSVNEFTPYSASNPIPRGLKTFSGLVYRIQLGVFSKPKPFDAFGGINPVYYEYTGNGATLKYYAGVFYSLNAVSSALEKVRSMGFPDAFIVAFQNGHSITTEKAREIEFEGYKL